jgi:hypothetical protein
VPAQLDVSAGWRGSIGGLRRGAAVGARLPDCGRGGPPTGLQAGLGVSRSGCPAAAWCCWRGRRRFVAPNPHTTWGCSQRHHVCLGAPFLPPRTRPKASSEDHRPPPGASGPQGVPPHLQATQATPHCNQSCRAPPPARGGGGGAAMAGGQRGRGRRGRRARARAAAGRIARPGARRRCRRR